MRRQGATRQEPAKAGSRETDAAGVSSWSLDDAGCRQSSAVEAGGLLLSILSAFRMTLDRGSMPLPADRVPTSDAPKAHRWSWRIAIGALVLVAASACSLPILGGDPRLERCGVRGTVARTVELAHARDFFAVLPEAGLAPELDQEAPAVAFVYLGPVEVPTLTRGPTRSAHNAICVVVQGEANGFVYTNVDLGDFEV
jgi:hypothetical protein